jgi:carboxylate-amine ligase
MDIPAPGNDKMAYSTLPYRYHLFQAFGVELEYMIVDSDTLQVRPVADKLLKHELGYYGADCVRGPVTWSNEMVLHVVELKTSQPATNLSRVGHLLADEVYYINTVLKQWNARLLPGGCHPAFRPAEETLLWPHESNEIYETYNRIFNCHGHGWSNLQSAHLNLPFYDDEEFAQLHAAVRIILPLIPALCASSPVIEGKPTGSKDTRLKYYRTSQSKIPSITGRVIPEAVFSRRTYLNTIYEKIKTDLKPFDPQGVLNPIWVNSRGAVPRFDRGTIELRLMDAQECPVAEMAVFVLLIETIKALTGGLFCTTAEQMKCKTDVLVSVLDRTIEEAEHARLPEIYAALFGFDSEQLTAGMLWKKIFNYLKDRGVQAVTTHERELNIILDEGTLASRILHSLQQHGKWQVVYRMLADCLNQNRMFIP